MGSIENRLQKMNLSLPPPKEAVANYLGAKRSGTLLFASGRVSELQGVVGHDVSEEEAYKAARDTLLNILAIVKNEIGDLNRISSVEKMQGFVRSSESFVRQPRVIDGASDLLVQLFGESGKHARTATGVNQLPFGACIQLDLIFRLKTAEE